MKAKKIEGSSPFGKYRVAMSGLNGYMSELRSRFDDIEYAIKYAESLHVPNKFGNVPKVRVFHLEDVDTHTVKQVNDFELA